MSKVSAVLSGEIDCRVASVYLYEWCVRLEIDMLVLPKFYYKMPFNFAGIYCKICLYKEREMIFLI